MKVYLDLDGQKYYGYDLLCDTDYSNSAKGCTALLAYPTYDLLTSDKIDALLDDNYVPKLGSEIQVVPKCPVAMDDIRKNYKIKRDVDTAECNVFSPYSSSKGRFWTYAFAVVPAKEIIIIINEYNYNGGYAKKLKNLVESYINAGLIGVTDKVIYNTASPCDFYFERIPEAYLMLLEGKLQKPCISYKKLEFAHTNEMTMDILTLVYNTGNKSWASGNVKNFQIQMQALNQYNWRDYKFTLSILFHEFLNGYGASSFVFGKKSQQPKAIRELLEIGYPRDEASRASDKDYAMAKRLVESLMDMENVKFTTVSTLLKKLDDHKLRFETFNLIYDTAVRITPNRNINTQND